MCNSIPSDCSAITQPDGNETNVRNAWRPCNLYSMLHAWASHMYDSRQQNGINVPKHIYDSFWVSNIKPDKLEYFEA